MAPAAPDPAPPPFGTPFWWQEGAAAPPLASAPPESCDLLVVGGGYTGLSAALTAARRGLSVVVIDAMQPGQGASSRNGGMVGALGRLVVPQMERAFGTDTTRALLQEGLRAYAFTRDLIRDEGIACDFRVTGRVVLSTTERAQAAAAAQAARIRELTGHDLQVLERDAVQEHVVTDAYVGALFYPDHGALQPRRFHDGLLARVLQAGAAVVAGCVFQGLSRQGGRYRVMTGRGAVTAERVLIATNGYTGAFTRRPRHLRWLSRRVFPLPSFIIATEPMDPARLKALAPGGRMMVETRAKHSYYRLSPDGRRVIFGGRAGMVPLSPRRAAARLKRTMLEIWPSLKDVRITHSWRGFTGFTFTQMPHLGRHEGVHFALGYSGSGVAMAPWLGMKAALQAMDDPAGETAWSLTEPETRIWYRGERAPLFLLPAELWYRQVVDRLERAAR